MWSGLWKLGLWYSLTTDLLTATGGEAFLYGLYTNFFLYLLALCHVRNDYHLVPGLLCSVYVGGFVFPCANILLHRGTFAFFSP